MTRYYLDTTAHLERHAGNAGVRNTIRSLLGGGRHASSSHVYREWRRIVDAGAVDVLNVLTGATEMRDIYSSLAQGGGRSPGQRLRLLSMLSGGETSTETLGIRARTFLRSESKALFEAGLDDVRDGSECGLAREVPRRKKGRWELKTLCKKAECQCRQDDFLEGRLADARSAASALDVDTARPHDRKTGKAALKILSSKPKLDRKGKNCWGGTLGGDISIALECASNETLLTTDQSFELICPALGIQHHLLSPTPPP